MHRAVSYSKFSKPISGDAVRVTVGTMGILGMSGIVGVPDPEDTGATEDAATDLRFDDLRDTIEENENVLLFTRVRGMWGASSVADTLGNWCPAEASTSSCGLPGGECNEIVNDFRLERLNMLRVSAVERDRPRPEGIPRPSAPEIERELEATELTLRMLAAPLPVVLLVRERGARTGMMTAPAPSPARLNVGEGACVSQSEFDDDDGDISVGELDWESELRAQAGIAGMGGVIPSADLERVGRVWTPSLGGAVALLEWVEVVVDGPVDAAFVTLAAAKAAKSGLDEILDGFARGRESGDGKLSWFSWMVVGPLGEIAGPASGEDRRGPLCLGIGPVECLRLSRVGRGPGCQVWMRIVSDCFSVNVNVDCILLTWRDPTVALILSTGALSWGESHSGEVVWKPAKRTVRG
jgi:hypothetical protein